MNYMNITEAPFALSGFAWFDKDKKFCRLPQDKLNIVTKDVRDAAWCSSGGTVRFKTDSDIIAIKAKSAYVPPENMTAINCAGFDLYLGSGAEKKYHGTAVPANGNVDFVFPDLDNSIKEWTVYFPLCGQLKNVSIGLSPDSQVFAPEPYAIEKPLVFYGSSITQGGCSCRPGNAYTSHVSRWLNADFFNFGFSGAARGEKEMAQILASLQMSAFIYDYDFNAPDAEHLRKTHAPFLEIIRNAHPDVPVICMSMPCIDPDLPEYRKRCERRDIIRSTVENATACGDKNIYFIDGETLFGDLHRDACTVDTTHPNDLGFMRMAQTIYPVLKNIFQA